MCDYCSCDLTPRAGTLPSSLSFLLPHTLPPLSGWPELGWFDPGGSVTHLTPECSLHAPLLVGEDGGHRPRAIAPPLHGKHDKMEEAWLWAFLVPVLPPHTLSPYQAPVRLPAPHGLELPAQAPQEGPDRFASAAASALPSLVPRPPKMNYRRLNKEVKRGTEGRAEAWPEPQHAGPENRVPALALGARAGAGPPCLPAEWETGWGRGSRLLSLASLHLALAVVGRGIS